MARAPLALAALLLLTPSIASPQQRPRSAWDVFDIWVAAIEQHAPGARDRSLRAMLELRTEELESAFAHMVHTLGPAIASVDRRPKFEGVFAPYASHGRAPAETTRLNLASDRVIRFGLQRFLKRAALLHADIALFEPAAHVTRRAGLGHLALDGRNAGDEGRTWHWMLGRAFLCLLPRLETDREARQWFQSVGNHLWATRDFTELLPHLERGLAAFPADAEMWFLKGLAHESQGGPSIQAAVDAQMAARRVVAGSSVQDVPNVRPTAGEHREAREAFRKAIELDPEHVESRIRLGRLSALNGEHERAVVQLSSALDRTAERRLQYLARLFLARAHELRGRPSEARASYEAAAMLYPLAQSPKLSLSQLSLLAGDREGTNGPLASLTKGAGREEDPWWTYHYERVPGREVWVARMRGVFREAVK